MQKHASCPLVRVPPPSQYPKQSSTHTLIHKLLPYMDKVTSLMRGPVVFHCIYSPFTALITCLECDDGRSVEKEAPAESYTFLVDLL